MSMRSNFGLQGTQASKRSAAGLRPLTPVVSRTKNYANEVPR